MPRLLRHTILALIFAAQCFAAHGQALVTSSIPAPDVYMDFAGNYSTGCSGAFTNCLSITRASPATTYAQDVAGNLISFAANTLRVTNQGLLVEELRTNLILQSQVFNTTWNLTNGTITADQITAPDGTLTADLFTDNNTNAAHDFFGTSNTLTAAPNTFSIYLKAGTLRYISVRAETVATTTYPWLTLDTQTGVIANNGTTNSTFGVATLANGWFRVWITWINTNTNSNTANMVIAGSNVSTAPISSATLGNAYIGSSQTFYAWGAQLELGSFPTSQIPTTTIAVTRSADVITAIGNLATIWNGSAGWAATTFGPRTQQAVPSLRLIGGATTKTLLYTSTNTNIGIYNGTIELLATIGGGGTTTTNLIKAASTFDATSRAVVANNGTVATDTNTSQSLSSPSIGSDGGSSQFFNDYIKRVSGGSLRLTNAQLQSLTTPYLLKRDVLPDAANGNTPMFLNEVA